MDNLDSLGSGGDSERKATPGQLQMAILAYIPFLCFVPLFNKDADAFAKAHGRQGLVLFVAEIIAAFMLMPIGQFFWMLVLVACLLASVAGVVAAYTGKPFVLPFLGKWADKI